MKKKILATLLVGTMVAGLVAGCGSNASGDNASANGTEAAATVDDEEMYNVVMQWPAIGEAPEGLADVEAAINEITASEGISVTLEPVGAFDLANETSLAVSSGEQLDLCLSLFSGVGALVNNGSVIEISDLLDEYGQDIKEVVGERQLTGGQYNGGTYAVPIHYVDGNGMGFICRKDILDKYGITVEPNRIYSYDELEEWFKTIKEGEGDNFYIFAGGYQSATLLGGCVSYDTLGQSEASGAILLGDGSTTVENIFATDEFKEFAERMYKWNQMGFFSADAASCTEDFTTQCAAGNYLGAMLQVGTSTNEDMLINADYTSSVGTEMIQIQTTPMVASTSMYSSVLWSIASTSENPAKAMQFLNMLYTNADLCNLLMYGIEGVSYEVVESDENGTVIQPIGGNPMAVPYWQNFGVYGDRFLWDVVAPNTTAYNAEKEAVSSNVDIESPALGYSFSIDNVSSQYSAVSSVVTQYLATIQTGSIDPAVELPEFLSALEAAGIDDVIAENQSQLDAWLAAQ